MNNNELRELVHLLLMCGIMDKTATESGNVTNEEWLRMKNLIKQYQEEGGINCEPDKSGDLISREALKKAFENLASDDYNEPIWYQQTVFETIDNAPTVELFCSYLSDGEVRQPCVEGPCEQDKPQGEWVIVKDKKWGDNVKCPFCGKELAGTDLNFCCKCGAKMKGGSEWHNL